MRRLEVGVGPVQRVALPIVVERRRLGSGQRRAPGSPGSRTRRCSRRGRARGRGLRGPGAGGRCSSPAPSAGRTRTRGARDRRRRTARAPSSSGRRDSPTCRRGSGTSRAAPGGSPSTSTWTVCARSGDASVLARATIRAKRSSSATSQTTCTASSGMPPPGASGSGASRVHRTTPSSVGSPDATPSVNGDRSKRGRVCSGAAWTGPAPRSGPQRVEREAVGPGRGRGQHASGVTEEAAAGEDDHERLTVSCPPARRPPSRRATRRRCRRACRRRRAGPPSRGSGRRTCGWRRAAAPPDRDRACGRGWRRRTAGRRSPRRRASDRRRRAASRTSATLLVDLLEHLRRRRPVEADLGRLGGDPGGAQQRRQAVRDAVDPARRRSRPFSARSTTLISSQRSFTASGVVTSAVPASGAKTCGCRRTSLARTSFSASVIVKSPVSAQSCERNTPSNTRSPISPFSSSRSPRSIGLDDFVRFLEHERQQRVERLLAIPRTAVGPRRIRISSTSASKASPGVVPAGGGTCAGAGAAGRT